MTNSQPNWPNQQGQQQPQSAQPIPNQAQPIPNQAQPIPNQAQPLQAMPNQVQPMPNQVQPMPNQVQPMPNQVQPMPNQVQPMPNQVQPMPNQVQPMPNQVQPMPNQVQPMPNQVQPMPNQVQPAQPFPAAGAMPMQPGQPRPGAAQPLQPMQQQAQPIAPNQPQPNQAQPFPLQPANQQQAQPFPNQPAQVPGQPQMLKPAGHSQPQMRQPLQPGQVQPQQPVPQQPVPQQRAAQPVPQQPVQPGSGAPQRLRPAGGQPAPTPQTAQPANKTVVPTQPKPTATASVPAAAGVAGGGFAIATDAKPAAAGGKSVKVYDSASDDEEEEQTPDAIKKAPPWLISSIFHAVVLTILGLLFIIPPRDNQVHIEVTYAETEGEQLIDEDLQSFEMETMEEVDPVLSEDLLAVEDPFAAPPDIPEVSLEAVSASSDIAAPSIGLALNGREKGQKKALLGAYGGTATTEAAVLRGLEWLKKNQKSDGSWSLVGPYSEGAPLENRSAATAMALLAFQGAGHTHKSAGQFKTTVAKGWNFLSKQMDADGNFFHEGPNHARLYTQAQCTIAICELYGMTRDEAYRKSAQKALDYCIRAQSPLGGWRYEPKQDSDTSVTGWFVMALQSGLVAGLEVPSPSLTQIGVFLDSVTNDKINYGYKVGQTPTLTMTAEALLCRQYLGWPQDQPELVQGVNYVNDNPIDYGEPNVYYWYYATQLTHHMDGEYWNRWNSVMREAVPRQQVQSGPEKGSWSSGSDRWGHHGGRLFTTCLSIYMLEVYYRHLPIYSYKLQK